MRKKGRERREGHNGGRERKGEGIKRWVDGWKLKDGRVRREAGRVK